MGNGLCRKAWIICNPCLPELLASFNCVSLRDTEKVEKAPGGVRFCLELRIWLPGHYAPATGFAVFSAGVIPGACPSKTTLPYESSSERASALKPVSLGAFRLALGSRNDVSLL